MNMPKQYDIALTVGVFDLLHEGHAELFATMRELAPFVVAVLHDDRSTWLNKRRMPAQGLHQRMTNLAATGMADAIMSVSAADPSDRIHAVHKEFCIESKFKSMVYVRGDDWKDFPGRKAIESLNIEIIFKKYTPGVSSTARRSEL